MQRYVAGFLFDHLRTDVALVVKNKPDWQAGKLNGIGGKIEPGETPHQAMVREFKEEAGADIKEWDCFCILNGNGFVVHFFRAFLPASKWLMHAVRTMESEPIVVHPISVLHSLKTMPNVQWLIPMALSMDKDGADRFLVKEELNVLGSIGAGTVRE